MKKLSFYIKLSLIIFLVVFSFVPKSVLADGFMIRPDPYSDRWDYSAETNQQVFINYDKGLQKMIISVGFIRGSRGNVVWLFPIPADPNKVTIDIVKNLPRLNGEEISNKAKLSLDNIKKFLHMTQIYTVPFALLSQPTYKAENIGFYNKGPKMGIYGSVEPNLDVVVYEHLEKEGITSEIITAKTATALYDYLKNKGLEIEIGSIPILDNYIGKEYSFVVSWINIPENFVFMQKGVFVTFPTKKIYYPLLPTSVYGSKTIPISIRIIGFVSPKVFQDIKRYIEIGYYIGRHNNFVDDLKNFYDKPTQNVKYTKIEINAPSNYFTDDLWISNSAPIKTYYSTFLVKYSVINALLLLIISSLITGILVGWIIFKPLRKNIVKLGLIGLSNCLSIFGLLITTVFVRTKEKAEDIEPLLIEIIQRGYFWRRRLGAIVLLVYSLFLILYFTFILSQIVKEINLFGLVYLPYIIKQQVILLFVLFILLLYFLRIILLIKRIKPEDRYLFKQLELSNYSSLTIQPKDKAKIIFVPLFSLCFLLISWLIIKFLKFIV